MLNLPHEKNKTNNIVFFIILSLCIVLGEGTCFVFSNSQTIFACDSCADISCNLGHTNSHGHVESIALHDSNSITISSQHIVIDYISFTEINSSIFLVSKIWQPPKL